ncbi:hypothetical protein [Pseudomonas citronellolis]|uniref:hypothetical protein n=1 Tax=Pseudomonas citronellolis TaxID=53408 RepID=UPI0020A07C18|nr:hypothetical protein [Pseudomonas citronellolis]MCP1605748.1 hypothetical protein [Pseudomonas citronellolis]MCP1656097.1 hypothetical protein [Pseudomonas citronellolis]MCP1722257.1 hypothetical protein [Pseudomonas citronellolis]
MQKHFSITQAMREQVADQLTIQAVAKHGPRIAADLAALNEQFWAKHQAKVEALPGLDKKHWGELIAAGALAAVIKSDVHYMKPRENREPTSSPIYLVYHDFKDDKRNALVLKIINSPAYEGVARFSYKGANHDRHWTIRLSSPNGSLPRLNGMDTITDPAQETLALLCAQELQQVMAGAETFRGQAMDVLLACRTSRQVEDLFPEAAKLLPQPVKQERALAPTELAANVRGMLNAGVPPVVAV